MPAGAALAEAGRRIGVRVEAEAVASNELLEERMAGAQFDVVFPSDYLVERLIARGELLELELPRAVLDRLLPWAHAAPHDPGCRRSLPFAFGTTGYLCDARLAGAGSWDALFQPPDGLAVGMLAEAREVVGAALMARGRSPNDVRDQPLRDARKLLLGQRPRVAGYSSDDFVRPVVRGDVAAHQAWSGPASAAVRAHDGLRYVVPEGRAGRWVTAGAVPAGARCSELARRLLIELADPELAALTTATEGFATPSRVARDLLPRDLREDAALFPPEEVLNRCCAFHDLGGHEASLTRIYDEVVAAR